jgi:hypothetical protein
MKKIKGKRFFEYKKSLHIQNDLGTQKVPMYSFTSYVSGIVRGNELDFVLCFDKCQEDWGFTNDLGIYGMQEVVNLLANDLDEADAEWKADTIKQLETWLNMLRGDDK